MTCDHCEGPVNVAMHHGDTLRCGCGKTMLPAELPDTQAVRGQTVNLEAVGSNPTPAALPQKDLEALLAMMILNKAKRVKCGEIEIELDPAAFAQPWTAQSTTMMGEEKSCRCGHSVAVEHNDSGLCLQGCDPEACAPASGAQ